VVGNADAIHGRGDHVHGKLGQDDVEGCSWFSWGAMVPGFEGEMLDMARVQECRYRILCPKSMPLWALGRERDKRGGGVGFDHGEKERMQSCQGW
jgi:hypothetical protein